jgi:polar amino acid transport system substrate-binding protein
MSPILRISVAALLACLSCSALGEKLRIVTEPWSPYVIVDGNRASGLDYDATAIVFERLGIDVEWHFLPWKRCLMMLSEGEADGVLDIFKDEARADLLYPSEPLSSVDWVLFQANARPHVVNGVEDLHGLSVGVSPGYRYSPAFDSSTAFIREPAPSHEANFGKLIRGRIDLMVTDRLLGQQMIEQLKLGGQVSQLPFVLNHRGQYLGLRRNAGMDLLAQRFSAELTRFKREPAYAKLVTQYTGETPATVSAESGKGVDKTVEQQESSAL